MSVVMAFMLSFIIFQSLPPLINCQSDTLSCRENRDNQKSGCFSHEEIGSFCHDYQNFFKPDLTWYIAAWRDTVDTRKFEFAKLQEYYMYPYKILPFDCDGPLREGFGIYARYTEIASHKYWIRFYPELVGSQQVNILRAEYFLNTTNYCFYFDFDYEMSIGINFGLNNSYLIQSTVVESDNVTKTFEVIFLTAENYEKRNILSHNEINVNPLELNEFKVYEIDTDLYESPCFTEVYALGYRRKSQIVQYLKIISIGVILVVLIILAFFLKRCIMKMKNN